MNVLVNDITLGIKAGKFWHNSPKYQTNWNVFATSQDWVNPKNEFYPVRFAFPNKEVSIKQPFRQKKKKKLVCLGEDRDKLWHHLTIILQQKQ